MNMVQEKQEQKQKQTEPRSSAARRTTGVPDEQAASKLFQSLPQELRLQIYSHLFSSTSPSSCGRTLSLWERAVARRSRIRAKPATTHALAVLQTCRRASAEIGDTWIGQILLHFEGPREMLDRLTPLPHSTLSKIRYLCVVADNWREDVHNTYHELSAALKLLPGLRLDALTVLGTRFAPVSYETLTGLIRESYGWKELHYLSHNSELLGFERLEDIYDSENYKVWRKPQPGYWQSILEKRDGAQTKPSVTIYRSTVPKCPGSVMNPKTRTQFEQKIPCSEALEAFGTTWDGQLLAAGERSKEFLVNVKRGCGVDYEGKEDSPHTTFEK